MIITLGNTTLCAGDVRSTDGAPAGPIGLRISEVPGVAVREFVGADRISPEHLGCDAGTVAFGVSRTFATVEEALDYIASGIASEDVEGQLKFGATPKFGPRSVITSRNVEIVGCTVNVNYTIQC